MLRDVFPRGKYWIRPQMPLDLEDGSSDPEPDMSVVAGTPDDFRAHPATALLAVEVADSSLSLDRKKAAYYAAAASLNTGSWTSANACWRCTASPLMNPAGRGSPTPRPKRGTRIVRFLN